jgi:mono/diheme cytochrome c family protein
MGLLGLLPFFAGCAIEWQNAQPAQELAQQAAPPGSVTAGERVFQDQCATCHGPGATGTARGPDLLPRVLAMGPNRFTDLVLHRYDWTAPAGPVTPRPGPAPGATAAPEMPAWQGRPRVQAHIIDLYAYLSARAEGTVAAPAARTP